MIDKVFAWPVGNFTVAVRVTVTRTAVVFTVPDCTSDTSFNGEIPLNMWSDINSFVVRASGELAGDD